MMSLRKLQLALALAYLAAGVLALARAPALLPTLGALTAIAIAYLFATALPDAQIPRRAWPSAVGAGLLVLAVLTLTAVFGGVGQMAWVEIACGFCAGNRLKAAGL